MTWRQLIARAWRIFWRWYWRPRRLARIERLEIALGMRDEEAQPGVLIPGATWKVEMRPGAVVSVNPGNHVQFLPNPPPFVLGAMVDHDEMERQHRTAREVRALQRIADANRRLRPSSPSATKAREPAGVR